MKHPSLDLLQDYFEAESESNFIKLHLESCDRCSRIISQMAKVDIFFSKTESINVSPIVKEQVLLTASEVLRSRRDQLEGRVERKKSRQEQSRKILEKISELRNDALSELKLPIMQSAALAMAVLIFTKVSTTHTEVEYYKIIENDTQVLDAEPEALEYLGEDNENN